MRGCPVKTTEQLEKRITYEKMLAGISEQAVSIDDLNNFLEVSLRNMGSILDVSRVFLFTNKSGTDSFTCICRWSAPGIATQAAPDQQIFSIPWAAQEMRNGHVINFQNTKDMPRVAYRDLLLKAEVKSTLTVPMFIRGVLYGFMGFDECRYHRKWIDEDIYILTTAAQIVTRAIENKLYEKELGQHRNRLESIFSSVQEAIITVDTSLNVTEANKAADKLCGVRAGKPFIDCAQGCTKACLTVLKGTLGSRRSIREYQIECGRDDRKKCVVMVNSSPLQDGGGSFLGAVMVIRDITKITRLEEELKYQQQFQRIIGRSEKMQKIFNMLRTLSNMKTTVLLTGESGTGKELVAHALHHAGLFVDKPFVKVNCSALAENLLESELFGHVKGAFTGADKDKIGRFEAANGGTILLDEIGDISPLIQLKLLRVLQEKEFERVGESTARKADVRIVASTNRDLKKAVQEGAFREDLYYRLNVINIKLPPLRERHEDIPLLTDYFCRTFNSVYAKKITGVSPEVLEMFLSYSWPGNIRELEHAIERAFVLCQEQTIQLDHLPAEIREARPRKGHEQGLRQALDNVDNILKALEKTDWNIAKAARLLGTSRWTMYRRIEQHQLRRPLD